GRWHRGGARWGRDLHRQRDPIVHRPAGAASGAAAIGVGRPLSHLPVPRGPKPSTQPARGATVTVVIDGDAGDDDRELTPTKMPSWRHHWGVDHTCHPGQRPSTRSAISAGRKNTLAGG